MEKRLVELFGYKSNEIGTGELHLVLSRFTFDSVVISVAYESNGIRNVTCNLLLRRGTGGLLNGQRT
jgi:hypothetical protein